MQTAAESQVLADFCNLKICSTSVVITVVHSVFSVFLWERGTKKILKYSWSASWNEIFSFQISGQNFDKRCDALGFSNFTFHMETVEQNKRKRKSILRESRESSLTTTWYAGVERVKVISRFDNWIWQILAPLSVSVADNVQTYLMAWKSLIGRAGTS